MSGDIGAFFWIPPEIRTEFWQDAVVKNRRSLRVICIMILGMELYNMVRVLFWSASGLGTANNRFYFGMYLSLWLAAVLTLTLDRLLRWRAARVQWTAQYLAAAAFLLWHVCLNAYDLSRDPDAETTIFTTAMLGIAVFIQMPGVFGFLCLATGYGLFMGLSGTTLESGTALNLTFTSIVALAVSLTACRHAVVVVEQRQEIGQMNRQLQRLLQQDPLTGILNKGAFEEQIARALERQQAGQSLSLLMVDLDDFKTINDRCGHPCGDHVLRETALRLQDAFPSAEAVGRVGGDEFSVLLTGPAAAAPEEDGRRLIRALETISWSGQTLGVCCSVGICRAAGPGVLYDRLYAAADRALYEAKRQGKGRCQLCELPA